jgi:16S rRNA (guanine(966)-N(2))-methyltransferase RsmD
MSLRITAGVLRGRTIQTVPGQAVRPSPSMLREALFNMIGPVIQGCRFLDLCAGSGAVGIEALSRGAAHATLVDNHPASLAAIRRNLETLGLPGRATTLRRDAARALAELARRGERFDVAFLDPPYDTGTVAACVRADGLRAIIPPRCRLYVQQRRGAAQPDAPGWRLVDERRFGDTALTTFEREEDGA